MDVLLLPALSDNCIYLAVSGGRAIAVDPGDPQPVLDELQTRGLTLTAVLLTHHHADHTAGGAVLRHRTGCAVMGPPECMHAGLTATVADGDRLELGVLAVTVLAVPGHTAGHVAYHAAEPGVVWTGDTLFAGGCGRVGTRSQELWRSLQRLAGLPAATSVWCGHDYASESLGFARDVLPGDPAIDARWARVAQAAGRDAVATTIGEERRSNIFLRSGENAVASAVGLTGAPARKVFAELRRRKDDW